MELFEIYQDKSNGLVAQYRKSSEKIKKSDHPKYNVEGARDYELKELKETLDREVAELNKEYQQKVTEAIAEQKKIAATSFFNTSETDKRAVKQQLNDFANDVAFAYTDKDKEDAYERLEQKLDYFSVEQLAEVRNQLPELARTVQDKGTMKKLRGLNSTLSELQTPEREHLKELEAALLENPSTDYWTIETVSKAGKKTI